MVNLVDCSCNEFVNLVKNKKLYCFGAGKRLETFVNSYYGINVEGIIDNYRYMDKIPVYINGKAVKVISAETFAKLCDQDSAVIITCAATEEVLEQLDSMPQCDGMDCYVDFLIPLQTEHTEIHIENRPQRAVIPKKIHYCWFGGKEMPIEYQKYMESWKKYCPDYEIIRWDESNYDVHKNRYVSEAYEQGKWAFVSDYARVDILYHEGGIYFDTDVELIASFDEFLVWDLFCGFEQGDYIAWGLGVGAVQGHPILKDILEVYEGMLFILEDGSLNMKTCPVIQSEVMQKYGFERNGKFQLIDNVVVFPKEFFAPTDHEGLVGRITEYTHSIHHYAHPIHNVEFSWADRKVWIAREQAGEAIRRIKQHDQKKIMDEYYAEQNRTSKIKKFQIWECLNDTNTAGSKAPMDIKQIFGRNGYQVIEIHPHIGTESDWSYRRNVQDWKKCYELIPQNSILLLQHPFWQVQKERNATLQKLKSEKNVRVISMVHDVEKLRGIFLSDYMRKEYAFMLQIADILIVHNAKMKEAILKDGVEEGKIVTLDIFDYLSDKTDSNTKAFEKSISIAGNLDAVKCPYIEKMQELEPLKVHLYGPNYTNITQDNDTGNITYHGSFPANMVQEQLKGGFGLVWDGNRIDTCAGGTGEYLRYNNPHKLSLYLAAGLPVIIWNEAAEAEFVKQKGVGITVASLYEAKEILEDMTEEQYTQYLVSVQKIADTIKAGRYTETAIRKAETLLENREI